MLSKTSSFIDIKKELATAEIYNFKDDDGNALDNQSGYQDVPLLTSLATSASGLSVTTAYSFKINGIEYSITTVSDVTNADIVTLINAQITGSYWCSWLNNIDSTNNGMRFTNDATGETSAIALTAGTTGTDLFASLTNWTDFDTAVAGNNDSFEESLQQSIDRVERDRLIPKISSTTYDSIAALDKVGLTESQTYIYYSSIYYAVAEFYLHLANYDKYNRHGQNENYSQDKVSKSSEGMTGREWAASDYIKRADYQLSLAGYSAISILQRRVSVHG